MDYRQRLLAYLRDHRSEIQYRIELFESKKARILEKRGDAEVDITQQVLVRLYKQLGEVGHLVQHAATAQETQSRSSVSDASGAATEAPPRKGNNAAGPTRHRP